MDEILHANIFFFITSIAVVLLTFLVSWALYYVVGILKNVRDISDRVDRGSVELEADLRELRTNIKHEGVKVATLFDFFMNIMESFLPKKKKKSRVVHETKAKEPVKEEQEGTEGL
jgi:hypothetical protein